MVRNIKQLVSDNSILQEHPLYDAYHKSLHDISLKDYPHDTYFRTDIDAIDVDAAEKALFAEEQDKTMDAMVGIADYSNNRMVNRRLLLVELRMDYDSTDCLRHSSLQGKVSHTRAIVHSEIRIDEDNVFVFRDDVVEQAKKWMFNMANEHTDASKWVALSPSEFENLLPLATSVAYQPANDMAEVQQQICRRIDEKDFDSLLNIIGHWHTAAEEYKLKYQHKEELHIKSHLHDAWQHIKDANCKLDTEALMYVEVIEEEYPYLK